MSDFPCSPRRPHRWHVRESGHITKSQLGHRGTILTEGELMAFEQKREPRTPGVITLDDLNQPRFFHFDSIVEAEREKMLLNIHDRALREIYCEIHSIKMPSHPETHFSRTELLDRGHWTEERINMFLEPESFSTSLLGVRIEYVIYSKTSVRKVERSEAYKALWQGEKEKRAARRKEIREKEKMTQSRLISERGWTKGLIDDLLGEPDLLVDNPHYKTAPQMRLYFLDRVKEIEETSPIFAKRRKNRLKKPLVKSPLASNKIPRL